MTFYWWSHWFWITFLNGILFFTIVQTYPSQEFKVVEYNQNISNKTVTKLFQQTSPTLWASPTTTTPTTASPTSTQIMDLTTKMINTNENFQQNVASKVEYEEVEAFEIESGKNIVEEPKEDATYMDENNEDYEFKRSAEIDKNRTHKLAELKLEKEFKKLTTNDTQTQQNAKSAIVKKIQTNKKPTITLAEDDTAAAVTGVASAVTADKIINNDKNADNNYSINFSNISTNNPTNLNNITSSSTFEPPSLLASTSNSSSGIPPPPSAPAAPQIFNSDTAAAAAEWLHTAIAPPSPPPPPLPPAVRAQQQQKQLNHNIDDISSNLVTIASTSNVQKIPFTLENANKEDELRRAESEHRSRKSKVLSADYKQINRYINYAADPKSLLTRSASTAPNDFNGDNESNISSEALAIQRTYFLDAGAISAICFTVFGVCCTVGTIGIVLYRRRYLNKPQALSEPDSSVYIDDSTMRVSDNSDEMYSLDNDSFLNSLEAMTIQNYWTDTVKHTKL